MPTEQRIDLIDRARVYQLACAGCTRHGETLGECCYDEPCERLIFAFTVAPAVDAVPVPCKIGDEVWGLMKCRYGTSPAKGVVHHMYFGEDMRLCICVRNVCRGEWGRNVFPTKEEAELALAEMNKKETMAIVSSSQKENEHE